MTPTAVVLRVEQLVLDGFAPGDRYHIGEAVERELGRLLAERGVPPSLVVSRAVTRLDGGAFGLAPGSRAEAIGLQVARAVHGGLNASE